MPVIDEADIPTYRARLKTTAAVLSLFCEALAVPVDRYQIHRESITWRHLAQKSPLVRAVVEFVSRHYSGPCRVSDLAKQFNCHPNYLGALFKVSVGQTLNEYVNRLRVERAQHLLRIGRLGVGEVGYRCGFSDPSHFGKIFRQFTGQSPQAFRESLKDEKAGTKPVHQP